MPTTSSDTARVAFGKYSGDALPAAPTMMLARIISSSLAWVPNIIDSPELDPSGQGRDPILVGAASSGSIEFPFVRSLWFEEMVSAVFRNTWATGTIGVEGPPGTFTPTAVGADEIVPGFLVNLYDIEQREQTPLAPSYQLFEKGAIGSMDIRIQPNELISGTVQVMAGDMTPSSAPIEDATYPDPGTYLPFTSPNVTEVSISDFAQTACFNSITLNFNSNLRAIDCIGELTAREKNIGRFQCGIDGQMFFTSNEAVEQLRAQTIFPISLVLADGSGNEYEFFYPRCKLTAAPVNMPVGTNQDIVQPLTIRASYSPNHGYTCKVKRTHSS